MIRHDTVRRDEGDGGGAQAPLLHRAPEKIVHRRQSERTPPPVDAYGTHARRELAAAQGATARPGVPPVASMADPSGREIPPREGPERRPRAQTPPPPPPPPTPAPAFDAPATPAVPEWLRVAKQNTEPPHGYPARPVVRPAERQLPPDAPPARVDVLGRPVGVTRSEELLRGVQAVEAAGYPEALVREQRALAAREAERTTGLRRYGAPPADAPPRRETEAPPAPPTRTASYPPTRPPAPPRARDLFDQPTYDPRAERPPQATLPDEGAPQAEDAQRPRNRYARRAEAPEGEAAEASAPRKPWLGVCVLVLLALAAGCWIASYFFTARTEQLKAARLESATALEQRYQLKYRELIEREAERNNIAPAFVAAIIRNESSFDPSAESSVGARGLMQLMEGTASWVAGKLGEEDAYSFDQMYEAEAGVRYGCWYLGYLSELFRGDPVLVAAAFHAGQNEIRNWLNDSRYSSDRVTIELENMMDGPTKAYTTRVLDAYAAYKRIYFESAGV